MQNAGLLTRLLVFRIADVQLEAVRPETEIGRGLSLFICTAMVIHSYAEDPLSMIEQL